MKPILPAVVFLCFGAAASGPSFSLPKTDAAGVAHLAATAAPGDHFVLELSTDFSSWLPLEVVSFPNGKATLDLPAGDGTLHAFRLRGLLPGELPAPFSFHAPVDPQIADSAFVSSAGATLVVVDSRGATARLEIPAGALLGSETITLEALGTTSAWPLSGELLAGVKIEPEGLLFARPARLTFTLPTVPSGTLAGVAWHGAGAELHARVLDPGPIEFAMEAGRLGGFGMARLGTGDLDALRSHPPTDLGDQLLADLELTALGAPPPGPAHRDGAALADVTPAAIAYTIAGYQRGVRPKLVAAAGDDSLVDQALGDYLMWRGSLELAPALAAVPAIQAAFADGVQLGADAILAGINRNADRCERHELKALGQIVRFGQQLEKSPWSSSLGAAGQNLYRQKVKNCATFDLDLDAEAVTSTPAGGVDSRVHTHWTIDFKDDALTDLTGAGPVPLEVTDTLGVPVCTFTAPAPRPGSCEIPEFKLVPSPRDLLSLTNTPDASKMSVLFNPFLSPPMEGIELDCPFAPPIPFEGYWTTVFGKAYFDSLVTTTRGQIYRIGDWTPGSDDILGEKNDTYTLADGELTIVLTAHWKLRHVPVPFH